MIKTCQICGKNSGMYPLCKKHLEMKQQGLVKKNEETGKWELINNNDIFNNLKEVEREIAEEEKLINKKCLLCGENINSSYTYCKNCYYNIQDRIDELDKNQKPTKLKDYYYNAKDYAMRIFDENKIYYQELTMCAISNILNNIYSDDSIELRLNKDIDNIKNNLENKNKRLTNTIKEPEKISELKIEHDKDKAKIKKAQDGHFVESEYEIKVDDMLYTNNIVHAYNIKVDEIIERSVYCDWYIPVLLNKGIYIELWGVKDEEKYNKNKKEKIELYKKHNLPLIEIEYNELKDDTQRLRSSLIGKIKMLSNEIIDKLKN